MEATPRGLFIGGDGMFKGGVRTGRVGFFDFNTVPFPAPLPDTTISTPIEGRVVANSEPFQITGTARVTTGTVGRVQVQVQDRDSGQYLQDNGTAFTTFAGTNNSINATLTRHRDDPHLVHPGHRHHQPQPPGHGAGVHRRDRRHGRLHQGDEEVRVLQHRGPDPHDGHQRSEREHPGLHHLHDDGHRQRRPGDQLPVVLVP